MTRFATILLLCALCGCQQRAPSVDSAPMNPPVVAPMVAPMADTDARDSAFVLPGDFSQSTSITDLQARFGKDNVKVVEQPDDSGGRRSVELFPHDPSRRAYVEFHDQATLEGLASISVRDPGSRWRGKHGVQIGMTFAELRRLNGKPFHFSGLDEEHRGWVRDQWSPALDDDDDRLGAFDVDGGERMYFGVDLRLRAASKNIPTNALPSDDAVSSDDPRYPRLGELLEVAAFNAYTSLDDEWE